MLLKSLGKHLLKLKVDAWVLKLGEWTVEVENRLWLSTHHIHHLRENWALRPLDILIHHWECEFSPPETIVFSC